MKNHFFLLLALFLASNEAIAQLSCGPLITSPVIEEGLTYELGTSFEFSQSCVSDVNTVNYIWSSGGPVLSTSSSGSFTPGTVGTVALTRSIFERGECEGYAAPDPRSCEGLGGTIFFSISRRPVAVVSAPGSVFKDVEVVLDGTGSNDLDGENFSYHWSITQAPPGSTNPFTGGIAGSSVGFRCNRSGIYTVQLVVSNALQSLPMLKNISCSNTKPIAIASATPNPLFFVTEGTDAVTLSAAASFDPDLPTLPLTYIWQLISKPNDSTAAFSGNGKIFSFFPDKAGDYVISLIVNDGEADSDPYTFTVTAKKYQFSALPIAIKVGEIGRTSVGGEVPSGVSKQFYIAGSVNGGIANIDGSGLLTFSPNGDFSGNTSIPVGIILSNGLSFNINVPATVAADSCIEKNALKGKVGGKNRFPLDDAGQTCGEESSQNPNGSPENSDCSDKPACGAPVNLFTGAMWHRFADFSIPGRTPATSLELIRYYTSHAAGPAGDFGPNWRHNYETMLIAASTSPGDLHWIDENGGPWLFRKQGNNYLPAPGQSARLQKLSDHYELKKTNNQIYEFSLQGKLLRIRDQYNQSIDLAYDGQNRLTQISAPMAGTLTIARNASGRIISIHRSRDNLTHSYAYDASGRLISSIDFANKSYSFTYNNSQPGTFAQGMLSSITDPLNRTITFTYYDNGRAAEQMEPMGGLRKFTYKSGSFRQTEVEEINLSRWLHTFDSGGRSLGIMQADGSKISQRYDENGYLSERRPEHGGAIRFMHDSRGNIISIQRGSDPVATTMEYDPVFNKPTLITPPLGAPTQFTLDPNTGDILQISRAGLSLQYSRDAFGNILSVNNGLTTYSYSRNSDGLLTGVFDLYNPQTLSYDSRNRLSQRAFVSGQVIQYGYDDYDRVTSILDSHGPDISMTYDTLGKILSRSVTDGSTTQTSTFAYDDQDRKISETDALGRTRQYIYDKEWFGRKIILKNPVAMIDEAGRRTEYKYDSMQRLIEVKDPRGAITKMTYDNRGNRTSVIDPAGKTTFFIYDLNDRLIQERRLAVAGNTVQAVTKHFFRDQAGRLVKVTEGIKGGIFRSSQYQYNSLDRIIQRLLLVESPTSTQVEDSSSYSYSNQLDAELLTSANNNIAHLGFGNDFAPPFKTTNFSLAAHQSGNPLNLLEGNYSIARDVTGEISAISTNGNAIFTKYYDPAGRLIGVSAGGGFTANIGYDGFGRKSGISYADGTTAQMLYDSLNRTTNINWSGVSAQNNGAPINESLSYDLAGNIIQLSREHGSYTLGYDSTDQLVSSTSSGNNNFVPYNRTLQYDFLGNRINDSINGAGNFAADFLQSNAQSSFLADAYGSVAQETAGSIIKNYTYRPDARTASFQSGNLSAGYFFDALDRRIAKSFNDNGQSYSQSYLFQDKEDRVLLAKAGNGDIYTYIDGQGIDEHFGHINGITAKYYVTDHLGSVLNTEAAGVAKTFGHSGELTASPAISQNSNPVMHGWQGLAFDAATGKWDNLARQYDQNTGTFLSQDPIGIFGGINLYGTRRNNPVKFVDPTGFDPLTPEQGQQIVEEAKTWRGTPYVYGGASKGTNGGADCSGSVHQIFGNVGFNYSVGNRATSTFANNNQFFQPSPNNKPQTGDVGLMPGHMVIYGADDINPSTDIWTAYRTGGKPYGSSNSQFWNDGDIKWYRYNTDSLYGPPPPTPLR